VLEDRGEYKTVERGRNSWRPTILVSLMNMHANVILVQVFAKYYTVMVHFGIVVNKVVGWWVFPHYFNFCLPTP
jgi:hypothetical protein